MVISNSDGKFQASYWRDPARIGEEPDSVEYSDYLMELKDRIQKLLRHGDFAHAAIFQWQAESNDWALVDEFTVNSNRPRPG
jgi:hypothetical protein